MKYVLFFSLYFINYAMMPDCHKYQFQNQKKIRNIHNPNLTIEVGGFWM